NLSALGHEITFYEPDAYDRQKHRDMEQPEWAKVEVYSSETDAGVFRCLDQAKRDSDLVVKASGVGVFDRLLEREVSGLGSSGKLIAFWDVDAPATLDRLRADPSDPFAVCVPKFDMIFTYGGGDPVCNAYRAIGARECTPIYNALDPSTHYPVEPNAEFHSDLSFLGNRLPDREARVEEFFFSAARLAETSSFLLGGNGWDDKPLPSNVRYVGHVYTGHHNAFNCTPRAVLNISRESMARYGFSPATRVFEAAGAGACLITDEWEGIELFLEPGREVLVARNGEEVAEQMNRLSSERAQEIGQNALARTLAEHTYEHRARQVDAILSGRSVSSTGR
ncbi:MAG TPA: glycosyltransferase, partial [Bryobacteraceae bacterium]|nr:glycosyltransferase [Bryobacteraceae bacterium]